MKYFEIFIRKLENVASISDFNDEVLINVDMIYFFRDIISSSEYIRKVSVGSDP